MSVKNPFNIILPQPLDEHDLNYLINCLKNDCISEKEKEELYLNYIRLALSIVSNYGWKINKDNDIISDLIQVAMLGILEAINDARSKLIDNNLTTYVASRIRKYIQKELDKQHLVPGRTRRTKIKLGKENELPKYERLSPKMLNSNNNINNNKVDNDILLQETEQILEKVIESERNLKIKEFKKVVLRLKTSGYSIAEISDIISIHQSTVSNWLRSIKKDYEELIKG